MSFCFDDLYDWSDEDKALKKTKAKEAALRRKIAESLREEIYRVNGAHLEPGECVVITDSSDDEVSVTRKTGSSESYIVEDSVGESFTLTYPKTLSVDKEKLGEAYKDLSEEEDLLFEVDYKMSASMYKDFKESDNFSGSYVESIVTEKDGMPSIKRD